MNDTYEVNISPELQERIGNWLRDEVHPPLVEKQLADSKFAKLVFTDEGGRTWPYTGADGGELTFCFTPTSLGTIFIIKHFSGAELDLTDYSTW